MKIKIAKNNRAYLGIIINKFACAIGKFPWAITTIKTTCPIYYHEKENVKTEIKIIPQRNIFNQLLCFEKVDTGYFQIRFMWFGFGWKI